MSYLFTISLLLLFLQTSWLSEIDDLASRAIFPPVVPEVEGEPRGHLKPLGWQRPPEGPIKEYTEALNANEFWELHVRDNIPLVYRGYIKESPSVEKWNDEYLAETYGDLDVLVEHKLEDRTSTSGRMRLADFLKNYKNQDMYVVSMFPTEMMSEVKAIPSVLCGTFRNYTHESNLWISAGGTRSVVHYDADHNIHCMLSGRKDFMMINNNITTKTNLYYKKKDPNSGSGFSFLDPDSIDMFKFKRIAKVPWTYATLYPGDCIFIPSRYIHQVRGYGRTIAVTTLFTADVVNNFNGDGCTEDIMKNYHTMAEIPFQWTYKKGDPTIDMGYMNVELVKHRVLDMLTDPKYTLTGKVSKKKFVRMVGAFSAFGRNETKMGNIWSDVFGFSDDFLFDASTIDTLSLEQWKKFCRAVESPHGVVTDGSEPVFVKPGERHQWEIEHPDDDDDDDDRMTEREKEMTKAARHDPMLNHLSKEEKEEYIKKLIEKKAKYGINIEPLEGIEDDDTDSEVNWVSELTWSIDEVPGKYQKAIRAGKIPADFKDAFMESLSDVIKTRFKDDFEKNRIPKELLRELVEVRNEYEGGSKEEMEEKFLLQEVPQEYQNAIKEGKIPEDYKEEFMKHLDDDMKEYFKDDLEKNIVPKVLLEELSDNGEHEENDEEEGVVLKLPHDHYLVTKKKQNLLSHGILPQEDLDLFIRNFPEDRVMLEKNKIPKSVLDTLSKAANHAIAEKSRNHERDEL